jgi:hypothetical protein
MTEAIARLKKLVKCLSAWKLRSRVVSKEEARLLRIYHFPGHWARQTARVGRRIPAIPASA